MSKPLSEYTKNTYKQTKLFNDSLNVKKEVKRKLIKEIPKIKVRKIELKISHRNLLRTAINDKINFQENGGNILYF